jgi:hypothetical protein
LTRAAIREEIEAGIKTGVAGMQGTRDLVRYFGGLQQAGGVIWCTSCCESAPAARLLDEDILPRHGIWDAMQDFKVLKSNVYRHFEGGKSAAHKLKQVAKKAKLSFMTRAFQTKWAAASL